MLVSIELKTNLSIYNGAASLKLLLTASTNYAKAAALLAHSLFEFTHFFKWTILVE